jgi:hypothetical protein
MSAAHVVVGVVVAVVVRSVRLDIVAIAALV